MPRYPDDEPGGHSAPPEETGWSSQTAEPQLPSGQSHPPPSAPPPPSPSVTPSPTVQPTSSPEAPDNAAAWDEISADYQTEFSISTDSPHFGPLAPDDTELKLCGEVEGKRVLDLGCGGGQSSVAFAKSGAHVIGIDVSRAQIEFARRLAAEEEVRVEFKVGDLADLAFVGAGSIDLVFSSYAIQYVDRFDRLCRSVERVLTHRGLFVFSHDHPFWDIVDSRTGAVRRSYFDTTPMDSNWAGDPSKPRMRSYHRTIAEIVTSLSRAGLELEAIHEPEPINEPTSPWAHYYPIEFMRKVPATLIVRARKAS